MTMRAKDYLTLPDRIVTDVELQMPEEVMQVYRTMEREHLLRCAEGDVVALTAATLVSKLLQLSCGFAYTDREDPYVYDDTKLQALRDLIEQTKDPILVFYQFRSDHDRLLKEIPGAEDLNVDKWCKGKQRIALAHPASAGYGLNLQSGGHVIVWYGLTWSYEQYEQANARLHRQGQELPVRIYRLVCTGTADQLVIRALERKHEGSQWLITQLLDKGKAGD
jgi:SNF2 family DNA or RNA helicase